MTTLTTISLCFHPIRSSTEELKFKRIWAHHGTSEDIAVILRGFEACANTYCLGGGSYESELWLCMCLPLHCWWGNATRIWESSEECKHTLEESSLRQNNLISWSLTFPTWLSMTSTTMFGWVCQQWYSYFQKQDASSGRSRLVRESASSIDI